MTDPLTREQLAVLEADFQRQLDRTQRVPIEPLITVNADMLRALFAAAKERDELELNLASAEQECDELRKRLAAMQRDRAELSDKLNGTPCAEIRWQQEMDELREAADATLEDEQAAHADTLRQLTTLRAMLVKAGEFIDNAASVDWPIADMQQRALILAEIRRTTLDQAAINARSAQEDGR